MKLIYFDMDAGRAEPTRIVLSAAGVDFEDHRISFAEFAKMRESFPLNAVPVIEVNDGVYTQSNAMTRYYGKQAGLYPEDAWQAFKCDEIMEMLEDLFHFTVRTFGLEGDALKTARDELASGHFTNYLKLLDVRLQAAGGAYFADNRLTIADLKVFVWVRALRSGVLDHVPVDLVDKVAPSIVAYMDRIAAEPIVSGYYSNRQKG